MGGSGNPIVGSESRNPSPSTIPVDGEYHSDPISTVIVVPANAATRYIRRNVLS
jgi:hypothetical protein